MKYVRAISTMLFGALIAATGTVSAQDVATDRGKQPITVGLAVLWEDRVYEDFSDNDKFSPVPLVMWEGEKFFFRINRFGYKLFESGPWEFAPIIEIEGDGYDSDNSDVLDGMSDRDPWIGAGAQLLWQPAKFGLKLRGTGDIGDNSNGGRFVGEVFYETLEGPWFVGVSAGAEYVSEGFNDYYYGVEISEEIPVVRPAYAPDDGTNFSVDGSIIYQGPSSNWMYLGYAKYTFFDSEVDNSPITDDDKMLSLGVGVAYTFGN